MTDLVKKLKRERDEARAEALRWRLEGEGLLRYASEAVSEAFQRGAKAMRESAAQEASRVTANFYEDAAGAAIRALPLPEDK
jgi:hypothetical protein